MSLNLCKSVANVVWLSILRRPCPDLQISFFSKILQSWLEVRKAGADGETTSHVKTGDKSGAKIGRQIGILKNQKLEIIRKKNDVRLLSF